MRSFSWLVLVRSFSYTPGTSFSEEFLLVGFSEEFLLHSCASFSEEFLLVGFSEEFLLHSWC